jgi:diketogulonate reductase-like aldo/keto reductase
VAARLGSTPRAVALAFLTRRESVLAIPKASKPAHVEELAHVPVLDDAALAEIERAFPLTPWRGLPSL